ncbi:hypothetical protein P1X14_03890 [Sphingomonas sp. AOB5]|uniref:hypothetical protein n=1 Tax=Sphingomonas sp. AOB5 TaxID=3034017 RepID=UPI0023F88377|nr:hypothetical protein [Sphingomonas sp. AOB5]MDF7774377.1 hypothetical protein [Sphingomonas sp. AOB5]
MTQISMRERLRTSFRERGAAFVCAVAIEVLIALLFLFALMPALTTKEKPKPPMFGFDVSEGEAIEPKKQATSEAKPKGSAQEKARVAEKVDPPVETEMEIPETPVKPANVLWLSRRDYAASDVGKSNPSSNAPPSTGTGETASVAGDSRRVEGSGPNGEPLYAAEWYREPTDRELGAYIPDRARGRQGWGMIACRTAANYRVEDCIELADGPRGSGYAGAVRQAAFQFRVRPPRVGGKSMVGTWVRIRIDYTVTRE